MIPTRIRRNPGGISFGPETSHIWKFILAGMHIRIGIPLECLPECWFYNYIMIIKKLFYLDYVVLGNYLSKYVILMGEGGVDQVLENFANPMPLSKFWIPLV